MQKRQQILTRKTTNNFEFTKKYKEGLSALSKVTHHNPSFDLGLGTIVELLRVLTRWECLANLSTTAHVYVNEWETVLRPFHASCYLHYTWHEVCPGIHMEQKKQCLFHSCLHTKLGGSCGENTFMLPAFPRHQIHWPKNPAKCQLYVTSTCLQNEIVNTHNWHRAGPVARVILMHHVGVVCTYSQIHEVFLCNKNGPRMCHSNGHLTKQW